MPKEHATGSPTTRRDSEQEKEAAVRMVRTLRTELGTDHGSIQRAARQLGYGTEPVRLWVCQADIDEGQDRSPHGSGVNRSRGSPHRSVIRVA